MITYPTPENNPKCKCYPNMMAAFFCSYGHMLECHFPMTCEEADCSHLARYRDGEDIGDIEGGDYSIDDESEAEHGT